MTMRIAALAGTVLVLGAGDIETGEPVMADTTKLAREWVEVQEECTTDRLVLRPSDYPVAPTRGGRRHLDLSKDGGARDMAQGSSDALGTVGQGGWSMRGDNLRIDLKGWSGTYEIEEVTRIGRRSGLEVRCREEAGETRA